MGASDAATRASRAMGERASPPPLRSPQRSGVSGSAGNTRKPGATKKPGYGRPTFAARPPRSTRRAATVSATTRSAREFGLTMASPDDTRAGHPRRDHDGNAQRALDSGHARISHVATMDTPPDHS